MDIHGFFDFLSNLTNLEYLNLSNNEITNINYLSSLSNLRCLILKNNSISSLYPLKNLNNLGEYFIDATGNQQRGYLDVSNNCIYDTGAYQTSDGKIENFNNIEILANLNKNGSLKILYINNNPGIIDFTPISKLKWINKTGF